MKRFVGTPGTMYVDDDFKPFLSKLFSTEHRSFLLPLSYLQAAAPFLTSYVTSSITTESKRGLRSESCWTPIFTCNSFDHSPSKLTQVLKVSHISLMASTSLFIRPFFYECRPNHLLGHDQNAFSKLT